ncbi:MBL fold metallo-hydrolase [Paraburkholderia phenoliruptrix]|uniref:MBL fold metallo-hydrolase n=1 Tax=Paraburkholderia phenoliruptrix TaxID=252970 RepID=UPI002869DFB7|nr:MBL fold metallo-hydrolase [Paraburkholderia phenoliruptrix]WMY10210.1 MBL fold metallo-hydrolase [Paraburkholderia phenoliruptrix]
MSKIAAPTSSSIHAPQWKHFPAGVHGFFRAPVVISGTNEALLVDAGFSFPDGTALVDAIRAPGKTLETVYISQSDPDYYFSLLPIREAFPQARIIAASETIEAIRATVEKKLAAWGPQLGDKGPQSLQQILLPDTYDGDVLTVEDTSIQIVPAAGLPNRRYLWAPSFNAIFGGVMVFADLHVWTADTPTAESRAAWIDNLDSMAARNPAVVVAGHMEPSAAVDASAITYTRDYLLAFAEELAKANGSDELIAAMNRRYPRAGMSVALDIGAKVAIGEMKWG